MVEKALFTSTYWECEACERPKVEECAYETTRYINCDTGLTDAARYVNGGYQPILKPFIMSIGVGQCSKSGPVEHHFVNPYASNFCACIESRLGKKLTLEDFTDAPINYGMFMFDCRTYVE